MLLPLAAVELEVVVVAAVLLLLLLLLLLFMLLLLFADGVLVWLLFALLFALVEVVRFGDFAPAATFGEVALKSEKGKKN